MRNRLFGCDRRTGGLVGPLDCAAEEEGKMREVRLTGQTLTVSGEITATDRGGRVRQFIGRFRAVRDLTVEEPGRYLDQISLTVVTTDELPVMCERLNPVQSAIVSSLLTELNVAAQKSVDVVQGSMGLRL